MPELPEVETIARGLNEGLVGRTITAFNVPWPTSLRGGTPVDFLKVVVDRRVSRVWRRAKLLIVDLEDGFQLAFHLKMSGRVVLLDRVPGDITHQRVVFTLDRGGPLVFADTRRFGYVRLCRPGELEQWDFYASLGPEPLEVGRGEFLELFAGRTARVKGLLLNQKVIAGVGNIYADESLFRAGIRPDARACDISRNRLELLYGELQAVLRQAIAENGSSIRDYVNAGGDAGGFQNSFLIYGRCGQSCCRCGGPLKKTVVAGRTSTYCPACQTLGRRARSK